ncbi:MULTISPECIES: hypothetical protein [unclassified Rhizobium]|uniref:hypothetical protein n=1 Tax=unclassified Rhizobium TaxID=2613769 RepID=UPI001615DDCA|nr:MULTISPECIES: hypothetical protein [unclassified Rhizobium]MBB3320233.1 hypothetical protein [Rhizobium sp. BK181]MBB3544740.1 hypothetical protein [Rhizobium sp. BK399]
MDPAERQVDFSEHVAGSDELMRSHRLIQRNSARDRRDHLPCSITSFSASNSGAPDWPF